MSVTVKDVQQFLGFASSHRKFAGIAKPFTRLTQKGVPFEWSEKCVVAFEELLVPFIVDVDANNVRLGAVLSKKI